MNVHTTTLTSQSRCSLPVITRSGDRDPSRPSATVPAIKCMHALAHRVVRKDCRRIHAQSRAQHAQHLPHEPQAHTRFNACNTSGGIGGLSCMAEGVSMAGEVPRSRVMKCLSAAPSMGRSGYSPTAIWLSWQQRVVHSCSCSAPGSSQTTEDSPAALLPGSRLGLPTPTRPSLSSQRSASSAALARTLMSSSFIAMQPAKPFCRCGAPPQWPDPQPRSY